MEKEAGWGTLKGEDRYFYESNPEAFYCLEVDGKVVGFMNSYEYNSQYGFLGNFIIDPTLRHSGLG